ncbi:hypothetical protein HPP92_018549 [Vanilla planifolia]|uniref:Pentatricopeptide repeat-containing protein n=1 Tax=Vanilla planifolia TaxID=51239 RepID=A0A835Q782_VANPL|nr:hypothetical protein HPP92_018549 [Vanilla planifolia]
MCSLRIYVASDVCDSKRCFSLADWIGNGSHFSVGLVSVRRKRVSEPIVGSFSSCAKQTSDQFSYGFAPGIAFRVSHCLHWHLTGHGGRKANIAVYAVEGDGFVSLQPELVEDCQPSEGEASKNWGCAIQSPVPKSLELHKKVCQESSVAKKSERTIQNRVDMMNKVAKRKVAKAFKIRKEEPSLYRRKGGGFENVLSCITPESRNAECNFVLKLLERSSDERAIHFFEWMRSNGKLKKNEVAYNLALRVLGRKEDWLGAELVLKEMIDTSECKLSPKSFNALIYVCAKRRIDGWGSKWFHLMLEKGVRPDVSTIGMLMGLYQKTGNLSEAEFTFSCMRNFKLQCVCAYSAMVTIYTRLGLCNKSEEIIHLMDRDGVLPNLENWLVRLNAYSQQGKMEEAELVLKSMGEAGFLPNIVAYNTLITGYGKLSNTKAAENVLQCLKSTGLEPDETTYRSMIEGFGREDNYKMTLWYYEQLKGSGFQPNSSNYHTMMNILARHGDEQGIIQILQDMKQSGCQYSSILSNLLQAYSRAGRMDAIPSILQDSFYEHILHNPTAFSIVIVAYVQNTFLKEAFQLLQDKKWEDAKYEENLRHLLICSFKEESLYDFAIATYNLLPKCEGSPNLHIACTMIDIYCATNRFTEAENIYLDLKNSGITLDMVSYNVILRMYLKSGSLKDACLVLDEMEKQKDIVPDSVLFRDMLRTYQQCGRLEKLANVYYWMLKSGVTWDETTYICVIICCGRALHIDEVSRLFDEMLQCGYAGNSTTFNVMIDIFGKAGLLGKARRIFLMARKQGMADVITYNTIIAAYGQNKDFKTMRSVVRRMEVSGFAVSLEAYNSMLDAYGKEDLIEEFNDVLRKMRQASCSSDHYTYNIMMNIYGKKGWIEDVSHVLAELRDRGLEPDLYSYNTLIKAYGIAGMVEEAVNVVKEMRTKGVEPDRITFTSIISALQRNEMFVEAIKWSLWMEHLGL